MLGGENPGEYGKEARADAGSPDAASGTSSDKEGVGDGNTAKGVCPRSKSISGKCKAWFTAATLPKLMMSFFGVVD